MEPHLPTQPTWRCSRCGAPWPCPAACTDLRAEFAGHTVSLAMYLGRCLVDASADLPDLPAGDLHRRFIGWLRAERNE